MQRTFKGMLFATAAGVVMLTAASAEAAFVPDLNRQGIGSTIPGGNFCDSINSSCTLDGSSSIIKIDFAQDPGKLSETSPFDGVEINSTEFPTINGEEFTFTFDGTGDDPFNSGLFDYTPDNPTDPGITGFVLKSATVNDVYLNDAVAFAGQPLTGVSFSTSTGQEVSHITLFDSKQVVPLPAAAWMMIGGLGCRRMPWPTRS